MILGGSWGFSMFFGCSFVIKGGSCLFLVLSVSWQFLVVFGGLCHFSVVLVGSSFPGSRSLLVIIGDSWWFLVVLNDLSGS